MRIALRSGEDAVQLIQIQQRVPDLGSLDCLATSNATVVLPTPPGPVISSVWTDAISG